MAVTLMENAPDWDKKARAGEWLATFTRLS
jgi:hypothetical protein